MFTGKNNPKNLRAKVISDDYWISFFDLSLINLNLKFVIN